MNTLTSNCLKDYKFLHVEIITTGANTTAYHLRETQGAEYGEEAERVRKLFQAAPDMYEALSHILEFDNKGLGEIGYQLAKKALHGIVNPLK